FIALLGLRDPSEERRHGACDLLDVAPRRMIGEDLSQVVSQEDLERRAIVERVELATPVSEERHLAPAFDGLGIGARARRDLDGDVTLEHARKIGPGLPERGLSAQEQSKHGQPWHEVSGSRSCVRHHWVLLSRIFENVYTSDRLVVYRGPRGGYSLL